MSVAVSGGCQGGVRPDAESCCHDEEQQPGPRFELDRHGAGGRYRPGGHRHRRCRYPRDLLQWPVRHSGLLAAGHRRARPRLPAHHLRRAGSRQIAAVGGLFLRGRRPGRRCGLGGQRRAPALLVGWSYGAVVAAHWADRNPDRAMGAVLVDGAFPYDWLDEAMEQRIRKLFKRLSWFTPLLRPTGLTPRMTAEQMAESNIELGKLSRARELGPLLDRSTVPVRYVVASGTSFGSRGDEQERIRTSLDGVCARNPNIRISAKVAGNHGAILRKDFRAIADAVRQTAPAGDQHGSPSR
ncbi:alpha/beta fold hydrolase [Nocardia sp. NPDC004750]